MLALAGHLATDTQLRLTKVICAKEDCPGAIAAKERGLNLVIVPYADKETYASRLAKALQGSDWVCLAGFMRLFPKEVLTRFPKRVLNIHPALLPKFGGKGMYGIHVHEAVVAAQEKESGCTIHYVTEEYDEGQIILQSKCVVEPHDTPEDLAARVLKLEHASYYLALKQVSNVR
jgi:phosphoribosylglycinamide formyltransferase 1